MDEENVKVEEIPAKKKKKRHFIVWVLLIALALMLFGQLLGELLEGAEQGKG